MRRLWYSQCERLIFAVYLQHLGDTNGSRSAVEEAVNAVGWIHQIAGYPTVTNFSFVRMILEGLQRRLARPKVRKEPVTKDMIYALVDNLGETPSLTDIRLISACLLAFSACLHYDKLAKLRCSDISFTTDHMAMHISSSKTDQYRQGDSVIVARTNTVSCPVSMLERYYAMAALSKQSKLCLFCGIVVTKSGECLRSQGSLSYTRLRQLFLAKLHSQGSLSIPG